MNIHNKRIGALVVFGMLMLILYTPTHIAEYWNPTYGSSDSLGIIIDADNNSTDQAFAVWHDGSPKDSPPGKELFRVQEDGKVGIGTQNPTETLDINGSLKVRDLPYDNNLHDIVVADAEGVLHTRDINTIGKDDDWYCTSTNTSSTDINSDIYTNGDVGIGTPDPTEKLDVNGNARIRDLPQDGTLNDLVVADEDGVLHTRDISTLGVGFNIITITDDYTPTSLDYTILVDASSNDVTVTLPPASDAFAQVLVLKRIDNDKKTDVTIEGDGSERIDGDPSVILKTQYMSYSIQSDGYGWYILSSYGFMGNSHIGSKNR